ncbi:MAG: Gfo/Idh/MocA family oxidoreductase [Thermomicrobiales bacterium]|nr:Gfo/Idh/MocA family oxidoreductase [Thermomicrobiales bacterium]
MANAERIKTAVVGAGLIGGQHARAFAANPRAELTLICDANGERAAAVAAEYGCAATTSLTDVANAAVDVVAIATPDFAHYEPAMTLLAAGKHLVIEKPLTTKTAEAVKIVNLARQKNLLVTVNLGLRWSPQFNTVRASLEAGEIGAPVFSYYRNSDSIYVPTKMLAWASQSGPQWFLFPHTMDLLRWLIGQEAVEVYAKGEKRVLANRGIDAFDAIQAMVQFDRSFATFESSWIVPDVYPAMVESQLTINGEQGRINVAGGNQAFELTSDSLGRHLYDRPSKWSFYQMPDWWWGAGRNLIDVLLDGGELAITAEDGLRVVAMIEATERSIATGKPVAIDAML